MTRAAVDALAAAETLQAWLDAQRDVASRNPIVIEMVAPPDPTAPAPRPDSTGLGEPAAGDARAEPVPAGQTHDDNSPQVVVSHRGDAASRPPASAMAPAHTDWLFNHLDVAGPPADVTAFRHAARGAGTIPWRLDLDAMREGFFHLLAAPPAPQVRTLSAAGARLLADELSVAVGRRQAVAAGRVGVSRACPFDLQSLLPVPTDILSLGPDHPAALDWLWTHWGTTHPLRHVALLSKSEVTDRLQLRFWSADWTPWPAIAALRVRWPMLRLDVRPQYDAT